ncbi:hypothetical protein R9S73_00300, partial [Escherichia coli]
EECANTPQRRLKTLQFCAKSFDPSNTTLSRVNTGLKRYFQPATYPLSINTRIARASNIAKTLIL